IRRDRTCDEAADDGLAAGETERWNAHGRAVGAGDDCRKHRADQQRCRQAGDFQRARKQQRNNEQNRPLDGRVPCLDALGTRGGRFHQANGTALVPGGSLASWSGSTWMVMRTPGISASSAFSMRSQMTWLSRTLMSPSTIRWN